jgi:hypothetical protein
MTFEEELTRMLGEDFVEGLDQLVSKGSLFGIEGSSENRWSTESKSFVETLDAQAEPGESRRQTYRRLLGNMIGELPSSIDLDRMVDAVLPKDSP